jgi:UV DNA damage repair endonuclease
VNEAARRNAIEEIEYHTEVMRLMGVAGGWHPDGAHINIHGGAREPGIVSFREGFAMLSEDARGLLTVENDEVSYGLEDLLPLADALPIVLDIHHHWIHSKGEHIRPDDPRVARVAGSWRGTRPVGHASLPRAELLAQIDADGDGMPDFASLVGAGVSTRDLRSHSDLMTGKAQLDWVASHLSWADLEIEAKHKNLATEGFAAWLEAAGHRS